MTAHLAMITETADTLKPAKATLMPVAIELSHVSKRFAMFAKPEDRLKQMVVPRLQRLVRATPGKYFREFGAVNDVSLTVRRGETVGIIGRNGSGKSTLLQLIVGTLTPTSGNLNVHGRIAALLELGAGFNPEFTGRENVYVNGAILGCSREEMDEKFEAIAAFANIGEFIERPVKTYSSGMFVRLAFAVATAVEPDILVVDEALSVGDEAFQRKCFARIEAIKERGGTILFVSHSAQTIVQLCDRAVLMEAGEKILEGEPKLVVGHYQRLVNASDDGAAKIKADISAMGGIARAVQTLNLTELEAIEGDHDDDATKNAPAGVENHRVYGLNANVVSSASLPASFNPDFKTETNIEYIMSGARIFDISIVDLNNKKVNFLVHGERYTIKYNVQFNRNVIKAGFGISIRTSLGIDISGQGSHWLGQGKNVNKNEIYEIKFPFFCQFLPGVYFINAGVSEHFETTYDQLHRIIDGFMFKVLPYDFDRPITGIVNITGEKMDIKDVLVELIYGS
jgi:lipopolysaccharide transport system ATP-binding protein